MSQSASPFRWGLIVLALVAVAAAVVTAVVLREPEPIVAPPSPTPSPSPVASPSPPALPQPEPFALKLRGVGVQELGNGRIFGRRGGNSRKGAAKPARAAVAELRSYLNAAFVDPATRFTDGPVDRLLTGKAEAELNRRSRRALGVNGPEYAGARTRRASARAVVLYDGRKAYAVTVTYGARMDLYLEGTDRRQPLRQRGVMVFIPTKAGWRADMVDVTLELPPPPDPPSPSPSPSASATPTAQETPS